ncbi:MAG: HEAT repeat domain-containing protein [Phycisphaerae bacterium]|jgi:HEAT repeat protein
MARIDKAIAIVFLVGLVAASQAKAQSRTPAASTRGASLEALVGQMSDPNRAARERIDAAAAILSQNNPREDEILRQCLAQDTDGVATSAIADAIAETRCQRREWVEPLLGVLTAGDPVARPAAARALVQYRNGVSESLYAIMEDPSAPPLSRVELVRAFLAIPDKRPIEVIVGLLDDGDPSVRAAAAQTLAKLTNTNSTGGDTQVWKLWWQANKDKDRTAFLADLAEGLARSRLALESENLRLRDRLARSTSDLYDAAPPAQRDAMLMLFLKDPAPEVRQGGLVLADRKVTANEKVGPAIHEEARGLLADPDPRVRQEAATLVADLADADALKSLLERLMVEEKPSVRQSVLKALGQLRRVEALPAVLVEVQSKYPDVSAAAAAALARIAGAHKLDDSQRQQAAGVLMARYAQAAHLAEQVDLREALLTAMGGVGDKSVAPVLQEALRDAAPKVRLAAVVSLGKVGPPEAASQLVELISDSDRGVRQATIASLGSLGGKMQLPLILKLSDPAVEPDVSIRQQASEVTLAILARCDGTTVLTADEQLAQRNESPAERIKILQIAVARLKAAGDRRLPAVQRQLAGLMRKAGRPAEAAGQLGDAYAAYPAGDAQREPVWAEWVDALMAADDPGCLTAMADQENEEAYAAAVGRLFTHLSQLRSQSNYAAISLLATEASVRLPHRLNAAQRTRLEAIIRDARTNQLAMDRATIRKLLPALAGPDGPARKAAVDTILAMSDNATLPLLSELQTIATAADGDRQAERAIAEMLRQVAPRFDDYDLAANLVDKKARIDDWMRKASE